MKFVIEGEEEIGSENLGQFLEKYKHMLAADFIVLSDTANFDTGVPALTYQLRGIVQVDLEVKVLDHPVHSGMWGGPVPDPVQILAALIADLRNKDGSLNIPGLYKDVAKPSKKQLKRIRSLPFDEKKFKKDAGTGEGHEALGREGLLRLRADLDAAVPHRDRHGVARVRGIVEPDRGLGARAAQPAHGAGHGRPQGGGAAGEEADPQAALRRAGDGEGQRDARPGGRPTPTGPPSRRRAARSRPGSRRTRP